MRRRCNKIGEKSGVPYVYMVVSPSDQIVKVYCSKSVSVYDIWCWHLSMYPKNPLAIFAFRNLEEVMQNISRRFSTRIINDAIFKCSFNEMRIALLLEQRKQNGVRLPMLSSLYLLYQRIMSFFSCLLSPESVSSRKYLHDGSFQNQFFADLKICSEGFTN